MRINGTEAIELCLFHQIVGRFKSLHRWLAVSIPTVMNGRKYTSRFDSMPKSGKNNIVGIGRECKIPPESFDGQSKNPEVGRNRVVIGGSKRDTKVVPLSQKRRTQSTPSKSFESLEGTISNQYALPKLPKNVANEIRQSFLIRETVKLQERRKTISQVLKRRRLKQSVRTSTKNIAKEEKSAKTDHFVKSSWQKELSRYNEIDRTLRKPTSNESLQKQSIHDGHNLSDQLKSDYHMCKAECHRFRKEIQLLNTNLFTKDEENLLLRKQVNQLTSEAKVVRAELIKWQTYAKKLRESQRREREAMKPGLISEARIGLTKALNDASRLEAKVFDLQTTIDARDRHVNELYDRIGRQSQTITEVTTKLSDTEILLNLNENEKMKLQDEVQVLIASKDGDDIEKTLRRLERARQRWLSDHEQRIEATRVMLEREYGRTLERETSRHRQEQEIQKENSSKKKRLEEKQQETVQYVNQQLDDMMKINRELQQTLTKERQEMLSEIEEKNDTIVGFELQISNLNKQIAVLNQSIESLTNNFQDAQKQNEQLQKKIKELTNDDVEVKKLKRRTMAQNKEIKSIDHRHAHDVPNQLSNEDIQEPRYYREKDVKENQNEINQSNQSIDHQYIQKQSELSNESIKNLRSYGNIGAKILDNSQPKSKKASNPRRSEKLDELLQGVMGEFRNNERAKPKTLRKTSRKLKKHVDRPQIRKKKPKKIAKSEENDEKTRRKDKTRKKKPRLKEKKSKNSIDKQLKKKRDVMKTKKQRKMKTDSKLNTVTTPETNECSLAVLKLDDSLSTDSGQNSLRIPRSIIFTPIQ